MTVSEILRKNKEEVLTAWLAKLDSEMPIIRDHLSPAIRNNIPDLLDAMILALEADKHKEVVFHSQEHGLERTKFKEYTLGHVIKEYNLLRKTLFELFDKHEDVNIEDRNTIMYVIDQAIEQAAETYHRVRQQVIINSRNVAEDQSLKLKVQDDKREQFIQSISHDLNNPLNNVSACVDLLEEDMDIQKIPKVLKIIKSSVNRAEGLIQDFLNTSTIDGDKTLPINRVTANITADILKEVHVYKAIHKRVINFHADKTIIANLDLDLIRRAFDNLMNNALKHTDPTSQIHVSCKQKNEQLVITINNEGQIPEDILKNIFNRYYQISNKTKACVRARF